MSSIRSILKKYGREVYLYTNSANQKETLDKSLDQALKDISELIDGVIGEDEIPMQKDGSCEIFLTTDILRREQRNRSKELLK